MVLAKVTGDMGPLKAETQAGDEGTQDFLSGNLTTASPALPTCRAFQREEPHIPALAEENLENLKTKWEQGRTSAAKASRKHSPTSDKVNMSPMLGATSLASFYPGQRVCLSAERLQAN